MQAGARTCAAACACSMPARTSPLHCLPTPSASFLHCPTPPPPPPHPCSSVSWTRTSCRWPPSTRCSRRQSSGGSCGGRAPTECCSSRQTPCWCTAASSPSCRSVGWLRVHARTHTGGRRGGRLGGWVGDRRRRLPPPAHTPAKPLAGPPARCPAVRLRGCPLASQERAVGAQAGGDAAGRGQRRAEPTVGAYHGGPGPGVRQHQRHAAGGWGACVGRTRPCALTGEAVVRGRGLAGVQRCRGVRSAARKHLCAFQLLFDLLRPCLSPPPCAASGGLPLGFNHGAAAGAVQAGAA